ncbi:MAG: hypothetical protein IPG34_20105 [Rhodocyclaceae bacterium]|nr:hypothetical protein [Rhodocyclaceae bacterium]
MSRLSSVDVVIKITDVDVIGAGAAAWVDISTQCLSWNGFPIEAITEEGHGYTSAWVFHETTRIKQMGDISLQVFTDLASGTAYSLLNAAIGDTRSLRVEIGGVGGAYKQANVIVAAGNNTAERGALLKTEFTLRLASLVTEGEVT